MSHLGSECYGGVYDKSPQAGPGNEKTQNGFLLFYRRQERPPSPPCPSSTSREIQPSPHVLPLLPPPHPFSSHPPPRASSPVLQSPPKPSLAWQRQSLSPGHRRSYSSPAGFRHKMSSPPPRRDADKSQAEKPTSHKLDLLEQASHTPTPPPPPPRQRSPEAPNSSPTSILMMQSCSPPQNSSALLKAHPRLLKAHLPLKSPLPFSKLTSPPQSSSSLLKAHPPSNCLTTASKLTPIPLPLLPNGLKHEIRRRPGAGGRGGGCALHLRVRGGWFCVRLEDLVRGMRKESREGW